MNKIPQASLPPTTLRARSERSKALRREALLNAALEQFYQNGYVATRMDDIAADAGFSKGTLYLYFASKEALFEALIADIALPKIEAFEAGLARLDSLAAELERFFELAAVMLRQSSWPKLVKILISDAQNFPEMVNLYREQVIKRAVALMVDALARAKKRKEITIRDPQLTARLVMAPVVFALIWIVVFESGDTAPLAVDKLLAEHKAYLFKALALNEG